MILYSRETSRTPSALDSEIIPSNTFNIIICSSLDTLAQTVMDIPSFMEVNVLLSAHQEPSPMRTAVLAAQQINIGMDISVYHAKTEKSGTISQSSVNVDKELTGMEIIVINVLEEELGIIKVKHVSVQLEKLGKTDNVFLAPMDSNITHRLSHVIAHMDNI